MAENRKYTVHLDITELERGTKMSAKDTEMTGLWVRGITTKDGQPESWEKFLMDWNAAEYIELLEMAGVGSKVDIVMEKEGRFWNIKNVYSKGKAFGSTATPSKQETNPGTKQQPEQQEMFAPPAITQVDLEPNFKPKAIELAVKLSGLMLQAGIIKSTKATPGVIYEGVLELADRFVAYMEGEDRTPKSDASPLQNPDGDPGVGDDDIPF